jgi:AcrR family transcriptional regulator
MPPKVTTTKGMILDTAFEIVREKGLVELSSRNIAKRLNCSITPIFSTYKKMSEVEIDVMKKAGDLLLEYTKREYTDNIFLNQGIGIVSFARDNKELYKEMFMKGSEHVEILLNFGSEMDNVAATDKHINMMTKDQSESVQMKMWIFTHGLAALACSDLLEDDSDEFFMKMLMETGRAVISDTLNPWKGKEGSPEA